MEQQPLFQSIFPQPFRVISLIQLTALSCAVSLHYYNHAHSNQKTSSSSSPHPQLYYAALSLGILILLGLATNQLLSTTTPLPPQTIIPLIAALPALTLLLNPFRLAPYSDHFRSSHRRLLAALKRIITPQPTTTLPDIIIADLLTSLARPLADLTLFITTSLNLTLNLQASLSIIANSLPYLLRLKQCINDMIVGPNNKLRSGMNALKYSTAIPMIILHSKLVHSTTTTTIAPQDHRTVEEAWILACLLNSIYSSWWDVVKDWGISTQQLLSWYHHHHHSVHRKTDLEAPLAINNNNNNTNRILFGPDQWWIYVGLIILNLCLRQTWIVGLVISDHQLGMRLSYLLQVLEVLRRAMWLVVRLEWADLSVPHDAAGYALLHVAHPQLEQEDPIISPPPDASHPLLAPSLHPDPKGPLLSLSSPTLSYNSKLEITQQPFPLNSPLPSSPLSHAQSTFLHPIPPPPLPPPPPSPPLP